MFEFGQKYQPIRRAFGLTYLIFYTIFITSKIKDFRFTEKKLFGKNGNLSYFRKSPNFLNMLNEKREKYPFEWYVSWVCLDYSPALGKRFLDQVCILRREISRVGGEDEKNRCYFIIASPRLRVGNGIPYALINNTSVYIKQAKQ